MIVRKLVLPGLILMLLASALRSEDKSSSEGWITLFNGKDTTGWKLRRDSYSLTRFFDASGKEIPGARKAKVDQKDVPVDAKGKELTGARLVDKEGKKIVVDGDGKPIPGARVAKIGGRDAIVDKAGKELKDVTTKTETVPNPDGGWAVIDGVLVSGTKPHGCDLYTDQKFTDFELHVEFQATANSGVYLQGRCEIQVNNDFGRKPTVVEKDGKKVEVFDTHQRGAIYSRIAPSKNMAKPPKEWQSFDVIFHGARGEDGKVTRKARVTLVWNGEKVIDNAEIDGVTGGAMDTKVTEAGPLMLQGDHGRASFRNIRIRPIK